MTKPTSDDPGWTPIPGALLRRCRFCLEPVYWKPQARHVDAYGNVIHDPPRQARLAPDGSVEYRDQPHRCRRG